MDFKPTLAKLVAWTTGRIEQEILLKIEFLVAENKILKQQLPRNPTFTDEQRKTLAGIGKRLGRKALSEVCSIVTPETILRWNRELIARKFDGSKQRGQKRPPGRPDIDPQTVEMILRMARENAAWGYNRIAGALKNLGHEVSDQTVGNVLDEHGILPAPQRKRGGNWAEFIAAHMDQLVASDFFTVEAWTPKGLVTYYVLFFIHLGTRSVELGGITEHPDEEWMKQVARNITVDGDGFLERMRCRYFIHDGDGKYAPAFDRILKDTGVEILDLPPRSPDLNAFAERFVRTVKEEAVERVILFGERGVWRVVQAFLGHYHQERNHQGLDNELILPERPAPEAPVAPRQVRCRKRLGGLLKFYEPKPKAA